MMRVYICKFFNDEGLEDKIGKLVTRSQKRFGDNLKVICLDEQLQQKLKLAGIPSEVLNVFWRHIDVENESKYERAYELSDQWHITAENNEKLKYHGINFLTLEYNMSLYSRVVEFSELCRQMMMQNYSVLILVVPQQVSPYSPTINTSLIKTLSYTKKNKITRRIFHLVYVVGHMLYAMFRGSLLLVQKYLKARSQKTYPTDNKRILFLTSSSLYARPARAICDECQRSSLTPFIGPYDPTLATFFQPYNFEFSKMLYFISSISLVSQIIKIIPLFFKIRKHLNTLKDEHGTNSDEFSAAYLCKEVLLDELPQLYYLAIYSTALSEKLLNITAPDLVCLMPDGYFLQEMAAEVAKKYKIPTLACAAALEHGNARSYMKHLHADKIAAMGQRIRDTYIASGLEPERAVVTGVAHFDLLFQRNKEQDARILQSKGIDSSKPIVVFATENLSVTETTEALRGVIEAVSKLEDIQLVVKVHPAEEPDPYIDTVKEYNNSRIHVTKDIDLYSLINLCELFIVKFSTTALEAMMIDKPVMVINLSGKPTPIPYSEEGAAFGVFCYSDIEPAILKVLYNEEIRAQLKIGRYNFVRAWAGEPDGKASTRIVNLMKEMIAESHRRKESLATDKNR